MLEARSYGPDLSEEERREIAERVASPALGVVVYDEVPVMSPTSVSLTHARMYALTASWARFVLVVDLIGVQRPDAKTRAALRQAVSEIAERLDHVAYVVGGDRVTGALAKLYGYVMGYRSVSTHGDRNEAIALARSKLTSP